MNRIVSALMLFVLCGSALDQTPKVKPSASAPQAVDKEYTDSILKNTTEKFFLTEFVDHLPASATEIGRAHV